MPDLVLRDHLILLFFSGLFLSLWLTPWVIRFSFRIDAVDRPVERKIHSSDVSRLGGVAMVAGLAVPLVLFQALDRVLAAFLVGALLVAATGFLDDVFRIRPWAKFLGEILAAAVFVCVSGVSLEEFGNFLGIGEMRSGALAPYLTVFCMVGVMNALNLSDGLDGLAGGISAIACAFLGIFAYLGQDGVALAIIVPLAGAVIGFLRHNTYPANLFMGDTGSLLLGYSLSAAAVIMSRNDGTGVHLAPTTVAAVLALPIMDTLLVMTRRIRHGENPFRPDKTHLHHRLIELGLPHAAVVPVLYVSSACFGLQAWLLREYPDWIQFGAVLGLGAVIYGMVFIAQRSGYRWDMTRDGKKAPRADGLHHVLAPIMGKSVRVAGWAIGFGLFLPTVLVRSVPRSVSLAALLVGGFIAVLFPWRSRMSRAGICYGLTYAACVSLLAILRVIPGAPNWMPDYLAILSGLVVAWVLLKMKYRGHKEIVLLSAFEILLIGISMLVPLAMVPALSLGDEVRRMTLTVCLESVVFLMAIKILIRGQPRRNHVIAGSFLVALLLIGAKGFLAGRLVTTGALGPPEARPPVSASVAVPFVPSQAPSAPPSASPTISPSRFTPPPSGSIR